MRMELVVRFDYGAVVPWVSQQEDGRLRLVAGPDTSVPRHERQDARRGLPHRRRVHRLRPDRRRASCSTGPPPSSAPARPTLRALDALQQVNEFWSDWAGTFKPCGRSRDAALRSLITLKALTHSADRRHRRRADHLAARAARRLAQLGLPLLLAARRHLHALCADRAPASSTRRGRGATGCCAPWRAARTTADHVRRRGRAPARRIRVRLAARLRGRHAGADRQRRRQTVPARRLRRGARRLLQSRAGRARPPTTTAWALEQALVDHLETIWREPDEGIWEVRGEHAPLHPLQGDGLGRVRPRGHARSRNSVSTGPLERWRRVRATRSTPRSASTASTPARNTFVQSYGSTELDASLLLIPLVGFLPPDDPRVRGTVAASSASCIRDGFVLRYDTGRQRSTGCRPGEGAFLACSFWLADNYVLLGPH